MNTDHLPILPSVEPSPITARDCTHCFAVPDAHAMIDVIHPVTGLSWYQGKSLEEIRQRDPGAEIMTVADFCAAKAARQDCPVEWMPVTEEEFNEALDIVPPAFMGNWGHLVGEPSDHHAVSGKPRFPAYRQRGRGKDYCASRPMLISEFRAVTDAGMTIVPRKHESTTQPGLFFWAEESQTLPGPTCFIVISQAKGFPATEAFDDWFAEFKSADEIARNLANGEPAV